MYYKNSNSMNCLLFGILLQEKRIVEAIKVLSKIAYYLSLSVQRILLLKNVCNNSLACSHAFYSNSYVVHYPHKSLCVCLHFGHRTGGARISKNASALAAQLFLLLLIRNSKREIREEQSLQTHKSSARYRRKCWSDRRKIASAKWAGDEYIAFQMHKPSN